VFERDDFQVLTLGVTLPKVSQRTLGFVINFLHVLGYMTLLFSKKQESYGPSNIADFGLLGVVVRANDKIARLRNILFDGGQNTLADESLTDTLLDLANYGVIGTMINSGIWKEEPVAETVHLQAPPEDSEVEDEEQELPVAGDDFYHTYNYYGLDTSEEPDIVDDYDDEETLGD
jgi:hypothetical protein